MQNAEPTLRSESRGQTCLYYAEPRGGKALEEGLIQNAEFKMQNAEFKMQNAKCKMQNAKCRMQNAKLNAKLLSALPYLPLLAVNYP